MPNLGILSGYNVIICTLLAIALIFFIGCSSSSPDEPRGPGRHFRTGHAGFRRRHGCARTGGVNHGRGGVGLREGHDDGGGLGHAGF